MNPINDQLMLNDTDGQSMETYTNDPYSGTVHPYHSLHATLTW